MAFSPTLDEAVAYLDGHVNFEKAASRRRAPTLDRMRALCALLGDPQDAFPVVHITGTNGKGSTARMVSALLATSGLSVGTYTSPHLERLNERLAWNGEPIDDDSLASALLDLQQYEDHLGVTLTHFEVLTAAALRWFADNAVDVAVLEVGLGGRWDSTNVADADVAVVTNIGLDHVEVIGPTLVEIATEKSGIVKPKSQVVLGETDPALVPIFTAREAAGLWQRDVDFGCVRNDVGLGGRVVDLQTPSGVVSDLLLPLYGRHQGDNAACALAAAEAFFGRPLDEHVVIDAFASVRVPGRMEVMRRNPLVLIDGAHNPDGARALATAIEEDFGGRTPDVLVVGYTAGRDPVEMLSIVGAPSASMVVACPPPHPRSLPVGSVVAAASGLGVPSVVGAASVAEALEVALRQGGSVLVTGSLYVVGDARAILRSSAGG